MNGNRRPAPLGLMAPLLLLVGSLLTGCSAPRLEGIVVPGQMAVVAVVDKDDSRMEQVGIPGAHVRVTLTGNGQTLVDTTTNEQGRFSIATRGQQLARGMVRVVVTAEGYARLDKTTHLRSYNRSLYLTMLRAPGYQPPDLPPASETPPPAGQAQRAAP